MSAITTHVLDTSRGVPASGVRAGLARQTMSGNWDEFASGETDADGRLNNLLPKNAMLEPGAYRLRFETAAYFQKLGIKTFYVEVSVNFRVDDPLTHYHVPLLLSPYGYTTYRGS